METKLFLRNTWKASTSLLFFKSEALILAFISSNSFVEDDVKLVDELPSPCSSERKRADSFSFSIYGRKEWIILEETSKMKSDNKI